MLHSVWPVYGQPERSQTWSGLFPSLNKTRNSKLCIPPLIFLSTAGLNITGISDAASATFSQNISTNVLLVPNRHISHAQNKHPLRSTAEIYGWKPDKIYSEDTLRHLVVAYHTIIIIIITAFTTTYIAVSPRIFGLCFPMIMNWRTCTG